MIVSEREIIRRLVTSLRQFAIPGACDSPPDERAACLCRWCEARAAIATATELIGDPEEG